MVDAENILQELLQYNSLLLHYFISYEIIYTSVKHTHSLYLFVSKQLLIITIHFPDFHSRNIFGRDDIDDTRKSQSLTHIQTSAGTKRIFKNNKQRFSLEILPFTLRDLSVSSGAGDQSQEELPVCFGNVITEDGFTSGMADGRAMHDGTPNWVLVALVLWHMLKRRSSSHNHNPSLRYRDTCSCFRWGVSSDLELLQAGLDHFG